MNVFEDLIVELKEENLLENTVVETDKQKRSDSETATGNPGAGFEIEILGETSEEIPAEPPPIKEKKAKLGKDFFNKRAIDEVSNLQTVEHVLTGVEREYLKVAPKAFDDFNVKKALHIFINVAENADSEEHKKAEFALMRETEAWSLALLERDKNVPVSFLRQYCENSRPALSSQAMLALARFYRNAQYSESIRAKFDFVITRLFSRSIEHDNRVCLFGRDEMLTHINKLYSDWSSIPLYDAEEDESNVMLTGLSFDDLAVEAESASNFDHLIESDFFGRLRLFKESINELFYEPSVVVSAIESNVRIGNAFVNLLIKERQKAEAADIQLKYGEFNEQSGSVSDAAGRTLELGGLLNALSDEVLQAQDNAQNETESTDADSVATVTVPVPTKAKKARSPFVERLIDNVKNVNRWLVGACLALLLASAGLYVWSTYIIESEVSTAGVVKVNLENSPLNEHIKTGRISRGTFYGLLQPSWDALPKEKREEFLQIVLQQGAEKGFTQVSLITKDGKPAGFATATKIEVHMP